jgi:hypothetical protein
MRKLSDEMEVRYPGIVIGGVGDKPHQRKPSDHNEDDTPGSKPAQTDPDNIPEHRAIDAMLGPAFSVLQAYALIGEILASPINRQRLYYINFENWQWSRSTDWEIHDNHDDPHPDHAHFSGWAPEDDNTAPWLTEGADMTPFIIHQEGRGWWIADGITRRPIMSEEELNALKERFGQVVSVANEEWYGTPPATPVPGSGASLEQVNDVIRAALIDFAQGGINSIE